MGIRLMIIKLGKYNSAEELLIETRTTGLQGHVCYWNGNQRASVTRAAVCMGWKGWGCEQGTGHIQMGSESGMSIEMWKMTAEQSKSVSTQ